MTVIKAEVPDVKTFKDVLLARQQRLHRVAETHNESLTVVVDDTVAAQELIDLIPEFVVAVRGVQRVHVRTQGADIGVDGHVIVVEHDYQVVGVGRGIIDALKGQSAADARVTDDGNHLAVLVVLEFGGNGHAECCRDGVGSMASGKGIVRALIGIGKSAQAVKFAVIIELVPPAGKNLVGIGLVANIPHETVVGSVEHVVQSHNDFHGTHTGGKMPGVAREFMNHILSQLVTHLRQFVEGQMAQVGWTVYLGEQRTVFLYIWLCRHCQFFFLTYFL